MKIMQNVLAHWCSNKMEDLIKKGMNLEPSTLDVFSKELSELLRSDARLKPLSENTCREIIVEYALKEYSTAIFGLNPLREGSREISDKTIRRMKRERKRGFTFLEK